ncbi:MAG: flagellar biosynthetic protein FliR [Clostridia bacterium]|nr:flagellar biosynthetic protein FliR [Clostridia bacterium]MCL6520969.1 flagellar biosynthetic protein FliR [Bacillota bacterium]
MALAWPWTFFFDPGRLALFGLVLARVTGMLLVAPFFGHAAVGWRVRAGLAVALALLLSFPLRPPAATLWSSGAAYVGSLLGELAVGTTIGLLALVVLSSVQLLGELLGIQMEFSLAQLLDPAFGQPVPLVGTLLWSLLLLLWLLADGHHALLAALAESFRRIPPGLFRWTPAWSELVLQTLAWSFETALALAAPLLAALLLVNAAFGLVARAAPQVNVLLAQLPALALVGILLLAALVPAFPLVVQAVAPRVEEVLAAWLSLR